MSDPKGPIPIFEQVAIKEMMEAAKNGRSINDFETVSFQWDGSKIHMPMDVAYVLGVIAGPEPSPEVQMKLDQFNLKFEEPYYQPHKLLEMSDFKQYNRKQIAELRPVSDEETALSLQLAGVSISNEDFKNGSPKSGDMIARNPKNHEDQWLVAAEYFKENFEEIKPAGDFKSRLIQEKLEVSDRAEKLDSFMNSENFSKIEVRQQELLKLQIQIMKSYEWVLNQRINLLP